MMNKLKMFVIKLEDGKMVKINAQNKNDAMMKLKMLIRSKKMLMVKRPMLKPGAVDNTRKMWKGRK